MGLGPGTYVCQVSLAPPSHVALPPTPPCGLGLGLGVCEPWIFPPPPLWGGGLGWLAG